MKKHLIFFVCFFYLLSFAAYARAEENNVWQERIKNDWPEYLFITGLYAADLLVETTPSWTAEPLIGGRTDLPFREETVPSLSLAVPLPLTFGGILFVPNNQGFLNDISYENAKGFAKSAGINILLTDVTKRIAGRKRPDYDDRVRLGEDLDYGRESFFSGHASISFNTATYASLYVFEHVGDLNNPYHVLGKSLFTATAVTLAGWTAYTRIADNLHNISDIVTGAVVGTTISLGVYALHNNWFWKDPENTIQPATISVSSTGNLINAGFRF